MLVSFDKIVGYDIIELYNNESDMTNDIAEYYRINKIDKTVVKINKKTLEMTKLSMSDLIEIPQCVPVWGQGSFIFGYTYNSFQYKYLRLHMYDCGTLNGGICIREQPIDFMLSSACTSENIANAEMHFMFGAFKGLNTISKILGLNIIEKQSTEKYLKNMYDKECERITNVFNREGFFKYDKWGGIGICQTNPYTRLFEIQLYQQHLYKLYGLFNSIIIKENNLKNAINKEHTIKKETVINKIEVPITDKKEEEENNCAICLGKYESPSVIKKCGHVYCTACIIDVFTKNAHQPIMKCPKCKINIKLTDIKKLYF
jgi:hypothetical protein